MLLVRTMLLDRNKIRKIIHKNQLKVVFFITALIILLAGVDWFFIQSGELFLFSPIFIKSVFFGLIIWSCVLYLLEIVLAEIFSSTDKK